MARAKVSITGHKEIDKILARMARKDQRRLLREGVKAGARIIRDEMKATAPVWTGGAKSKGKPGDLRKGIRVKGARSRNRSVLTYNAGSYAPHAYLVTFGNTKTRPRRWKQGKSTGHMPPNPFVQRAFVRKGKEASIRGSRIIRAAVLRALQGRAVSR